MDFNDVFREYPKITCYKCGTEKEIFSKRQYSFKIQVKGKKGGYIYFCKYSCYRAYQKELQEKRKEKKEQKRLLTEKEMQQDCYYNYKITFEKKGYYKAIDEYLQQANVGDTFTPNVVWNWVRGQRNGKSKFGVDKQKYQFIADILSKKPCVKFLGTNHNRNVNSLVFEKVDANGESIEKEGCSTE